MPLPDKQPVNEPKGAEKAAKSAYEKGQEVVSQPEGEVIVSINTSNNPVTCSILILLIIVLCVIFGILLFRLLGA